MMIRTSSFLAAAATLATTAAVAVPVGAASAATKINRCGALSTSNGGKAGNIKASKVGCKTARAVAKRANGKKKYSASRFTCNGLNGFYVCGGPHSGQVIVFAYRKPKH